MRKYLLFFILLFVGLKFGIGYLFSEKFHTYADTTKAPWTCQLTNLMGDTLQILDKPQEAQRYYQRVVARCPKTPMAEKAAYGVAQSWGYMGRTDFAVNAYTNFIEEYKDSPRVADAQRAITRMKSTRF